MKTTLFRVALVVVAGMVMTGCSSMPNSYTPEKVGYIYRPATEAPLALSIWAEEQETEIGVPIRFAYTIRNVSAVEMVVPAEPVIRFHFIYPNGRRDQYLKEFHPSQFYRSEEVVRLAPGEEMSGTYDVKTYYFNRKGITEFSAILHAAANTNPELEKVWNGQLVSNSFGVMIHPTGKKGREAIRLLETAADNSSGERSDPST